MCSLRPARCNRGPEEEVKIKKIIVTHGKNSPQEKELLVAAGVESSPAVGLQNCGVDQRSGGPGGTEVGQGHTLTCCCITG